VCRLHTKFKAALKVACAPAQVIWAPIKTIPIDPPQWQPYFLNARQIRSRDFVADFSTCSLYLTKIRIAARRVSLRQKKGPQFRCSPMPIQYSPLPLGADFERLVHRIVQILEKGSSLLIREMPE
jgi:hypothetical protein